MKPDVNVPCAVCGGHESHLLHEIDYTRYGYPGLFAVRECTGCGLLFNSPRLPEAEITQLYDGNYYVFQEREREAVRRVGELLERTVGVAASRVTESRVLEVGCAKGYLLAMLQGQGWQAEGVELSAAAARHARRRFGLSVYEGTLEAYVEQPGHQPHPVVVTTDVIEHVPDLDGFVAALGHAVAPDGLLVVGTPNAQSDHRRAHGEQWLGFNPFHIFLLSRDTLNTLLVRHGFEVLDAYSYTNGDPPPPYRPSAWKAQVRSALQHTGLFEGLQALRHDTLRIVDAMLYPAPQLIKAAAVAAPITGRYEDSDDGRHARRRACRGDNLVVIARKRAGAG